MNSNKVNMSLTEQGAMASDTGKKAFDFLGLPSEIREMIYHHSLTSRRIRPRHRLIATRWTPINLLYACRTIYEEAFIHLYTKGEFVFQVNPGSVCGLATRLGRIGSRARKGMDLSVDSKNITNLIKNVVLEIHWPTPDHASVTDEDPLLKQTMVTAAAMLSQLPALRTIDVSWVQTTLRTWESAQHAPPDYKIPVYLRALKRVRRRNEKVRVRMPADGPVSSEELEWGQRDSRDGVLDKVKEIKEDLAELGGMLKEIFG